MTISEISARLGSDTLRAHGAAVLVAALELEASDVSMLRDRLIGYVVGLEDGKITKRELEIKELVEMAIGAARRVAA